MSHTHETAPPDGELERLLNDLLELRESIVLRANRRLRHYPEAEGGKGACNLGHYLALREADRRPLQERLARHGLSSLGRGEPHVLGTIDAIIRILMAATGQEVMMMMAESCPAPGFDEGAAMLESNSNALLGPAGNGRSTRIMVTLSSEAARDYERVRDLLVHGADCVRINCAHDEAGSWAAMIANVRRASDETGRPCRVLMDLAGHKLRTGPLELGPAVQHLRVKRDPFGQIVEPARLLLLPYGSPFEPPVGQGEQRLLLPAAWLERLSPGGRLRFVDCRGKERWIEPLRPLEQGGWYAECDRPAYLSSETRFQLVTADGEEALGPLGEACLPRSELAIRVRQGERLWLTSSQQPGRAAQRDGDGQPIAHAQIGCTLPEVLEQVRVGDPVWIDDGKVGAVVEEKSDQGLLLQITHTAPKGAKIRADKGLNFPDTPLNLPPLSERDRRDLDFICSHADMVGFSFVESLSQMQRLLAELDRRGAGSMPVIAKIETRKAVKNLPEILLGTIGERRLGIMIARGDLAVELGSVRMAEIQEEILWLCEAAHVPVIWATQVLETIAKKGVRSRPEFTDAAMGVRAECVMLNKGPYINNAIEALDHVLVKMQDHQHKKISRMRALHLHW
ncbi:MAG: pyruvate kinase [Pseudomonadota bacterium]